MSEMRSQSILPHPAAPHTFEDSGLSKDLLLQLALKTLHFAGELTGSEMAQRLGVSFSVIEPALDLVKAQHHCEIVGGALLGGASFRYRITDAGRSRAALFLEHNETSAWPRCRSANTRSTCAGIASPRRAQRRRIECVRHSPNWC